MNEWEIIYLISVAVNMGFLMYESYEEKGLPAFILPSAIIMIAPVINTIFGLGLLWAAAYELFNKPHDQVRTRKRN